jgi:hypothetical protein
MFGSLLNHKEEKPLPSGVGSGWRDREASSQSQDFGEHTDQLLRCELSPTR